MHKVASFNGELVPSDEPTISALSSTALYGSGVFTTIAVYAGRPFLLIKHWDRLHHDSERLGLDISTQSLESVERQITELIAANSLTDGRARVTIFDRSGSSLWTDIANKGIDVLITTADKREVKPEPRLTVSPFTTNSRSPLTGIKSGNYLENLLALKEAQARGFDETLRLNERGDVSSACMANVFWLKNRSLYTPSLDTGCLVGTTRAFILETFDCSEIEAGFDQLLDADSLFICSAGIEIKQVRSLDDRLFVQGDHELLHLFPPNEKTRMSAI